MKKFVLLVAVCWSLVSAGSVSAATFEDANAKYQAGDFKAAAALYEDLAKAGGGSGAVYYDLGNAYFRLGMKGKTLVNYVRAFRRLPRDPDVRWNLELVRSTVPDRSGSREGNFMRAWAGAAADLFTFDEVCLSITAGLLAFLGLVLLAIYAPQLKLLPHMVQGAVLLFLLAATALFGLKWADVRDPRAVVLEKEVYAHYGPSERETKAFLLREGAEVRLLDESKGWLYVTLNDKDPGWIPKGSCEIV
ncbi:MAG: hypothetical protein ACREH5_00345 [Candidatus Omnitrophota bacterium]